MTHAVNGGARACAKTLATLALLTAAPLAHSASVTLYGIIDTFVEYSDHNVSTVNGVTTSGSKYRMGNGGLAGQRFGLRGEEQLGGGVTAFFILENGFNLATGQQLDSARLFNRHAAIGMEGGFGRVAAGRQYTTMFDFMVALSPLGVGATYEPLSSITSVRTDNMLKYRFKSGGLTASTHWAFGEQPGSFQGNAAYGAGASYALGPATVALIYDQANGVDGVLGYDRTRRAALAVRYLLGDLKISAGYRWGKNNAAAGEQTLRDDLWYLGLGYPLTHAWTVNLAYYQKNVKQQAGVSDPEDPRQVAAQAIYALSKRTSVYGAIGHARDGALNFAALSTLETGKSRQTGFALGIQHRF